MALPNFFDKAALAASHILRGFDKDTIAATLLSKEPTLFFDGSADNSVEGRWTLELSTNLLARLYPRISIVGPPDSKCLPELIKVAQAINCDIEIGTSLTAHAVCLVVGNRKPDVEVSAIYVGSDGWIVEISSLAPIGSGNSTVPFGALTAACLGCANIFRAVFKDQLPDPRFDHHCRMSLLDFDLRNPSPRNPAVKNCDISETHLVGIGAIGNGCVWALSKMPWLTGRLHLIDHENVDLSNLQRYVLATQPDVGRPKIELGNEKFSSSKLAIISHPLRWGCYLQRRNDWMIDTIAVAVDSARDRQAIQASLPKWIVNAWTQVGYLGVSRHDFVGEQSCLMCLYFPDGAARNEDEIVAEAIGLPGATRGVRTLLQTNGPLGIDELNAIANANGIQVSEIMTFVGKPLRTFYSDAVCGGALLRLGVNAASQRQIEVPMAFQSALAGVLLAAEIVAKASGLAQSNPPVMTQMDLTRPLNGVLSSREPKQRSNCICRDDQYVAVYNAKYNRI